MADTFSNPIFRDNQWHVNKNGVDMVFDPDAYHAGKGFVPLGAKPTAVAKPVTTAKPVAKSAAQAQIVPGVPSTSSQVNATDYAGKIAANPSLAVTPAEKLSTQVPTINASTTGTNVTNKAVNKPTQFDATTTTAPAPAQATTATGGAATQAAQVDPRIAQTYEAKTTQKDVLQNGQMTAQTQDGLNPNAVIEAPQIDMQGTATGVNEDGSINYTGQALQDYAHQGMEVLDTSTPEGKARALELGDGNYTDSQATLKGQLAKLQADFVGPNGEPKIPVYAAETARNVSRIAAFKGMTGTAATAAMSQALHEASITVATQDAQFFQTLTLQNLNNKQAQTINRANVLAKMDQVNADNRMAAAIENSKKFMELDMKNLDNRQQAEVLNTAARVQSILEDAKAVNAARMFGAEQANDLSKFYDQLNSSINMYNVGQQNSMAQFNAGEINAQSRFNVGEKNTTARFNADQINAQERFNSELENNRQQFYSTMQYNVDISNAKWRQTVTTTNAQMKFEAAAVDVKNLVGISQEALNQIWDRSDALLDYVFKAGQNDKDRAAILAGQKLTAQTADKAGTGQLLGTLAGTFLGSGTGQKLLDNLFFG